MRTNFRMMAVNVSLVLAVLAVGFPGMCQAAGAPIRSLRGNDQGVDAPRLDFRQQFESADFAFDLQGAEPEIEGDAGTVKVANLGNLPVRRRGVVCPRRDRALRLEPTASPPPRSRARLHRKVRDFNLRAPRLRRREHRAPDYERHWRGTGCLGAGRFGPFRAEHGV